MLYNIKYFEGQKVSRFGRTATFLHFTDVNFCRWLILRQYTGISFRGQHIFIKFADVNFHGWGQKTRKPRNFLPTKEAFFHCQQYMILVSINYWFLRGKFKGTQSSGFEKKSNLCVFFWVTSLYGNSVSLKGKSLNFELEFSQ